MDLNEMQVAEAAVAVSGLLQRVGTTVSKVRNLPTYDLVHVLSTYLTCTSSLKHNHPLLSSIYHFMI